MHVCHFHGNRHSREFGKELAFRAQCQLSDSRIAAVLSEIQETAYSCPSRLQLGAAFPAKSCALLIARAALGTFGQAQRSAAVVAEFAFPRRLAAVGAYCLLAFNRAAENLGPFSRVLYILDHLAGPGRRHFHVDARRVVHAKALLFIPVGLANIALAFRTAVKMLSGFVLRQFESCFMEAGKARLQGDFRRQANESEVENLRRKNNRLKVLLAEQLLETSLFKKSLRGSDDTGITE